MLFSQNILTDKSGFSYVEVLAATILIGTCLVPMLNGLYSIIRGPAILEESVVNRLALQSKLDALLIEPFPNLIAAYTVAGSINVPTSYSDIITSSDNRQINRNVYISYYDADNLDGDNDPFTGVDQNLFYVKVTASDSIAPLETLISQ